MNNDDELLDRAVRAGHAGGPVQHCWACRRHAFNRTPLAAAVAEAIRAEWRRLKARKLIHFLNTGCSTYNAHRG